MSKKFGHWVVANDGIEWDEKKAGKYFIPSNRLLELTERRGVDMYDWLVHIPEKSWVENQDASDLNEAFKYLSAQLKLEIDEQIYNDSINYQINDILD